MKRNQTKLLPLAFGVFWYIHSEPIIIEEFGHLRKASVFFLCLKSQIANKRRPKKVRPPYKRYVYKSSFANTANSSDEESDTEVGTHSDQQGNYKDFSRKTNLNISSVKPSQFTHLSFPRSSISINDYKSINWPPKLSYLRISGGISDDFLRDSHFPSTINQIEFAHCPAISDVGLGNLLLRIGRNLKSLRIQYPMPGLKTESLDDVFRFCPNLYTLEVAVDYVSTRFFDEENLQYMDSFRPLRTMYINSSGSLGTSTKLDPIDLAVAINEDRLPFLKNLQVTAKLGWDPKSEYVTYIADELDERNGGLYIGY
ncbi:hypothetical protein G9P44_005151 [Scheffersomyces stipitis]|nr:hypothetical protein G9P44_005151 [Scheffersomyces stipitis]